MTAPSEGPGAVRDALVVLALSALVFAVAHRHGLADPFVINDDARQQIYWMQRWRDAALYPPNLLNDFARAYVPAGVKALYYAAAQVIEPLFFTKILAGILFCTLGLAFFWIGRRLGGRCLGFFCAASAWLSPFFLLNISGGLSRAFAAPLLALFLLAWLRASGRGMAACLLFASVTIPYMAVLATGSCLLAFAASRLGRAGPPPFPARAVDFGVIAVCAVSVLAMNHGLTAEGFGPLATVADMAGNPAFSASGRLDLYPLPNPFFDLVYTPFEGIGLFLDLGLGAGIASLAAIAAVAALGARRIGSRPIRTGLAPMAFLLLASLALYLAARILALRLFVPDRYVSYSVNILYALGLATLFRHALAPLLRRRGVAAALLLLAAVAGAIRLTDAGLYDYGADATLYATARLTPADATFAGHPELMDNLLTFGHRNVQASFELAHPWMTGYWRRYEPRLDDLFTAYYAADPEAVTAFCRRYGVDFLVVDEAHFTPGFLAGRPFFAPFDGRIREIAAATLADGRGFAILDEKRFPYVRVGGTLRLLDVRGMTAGNNEP